ncbi:UNKNOWN [Stylonychia lemnae]|uniref:Uncharacterized protein n=1 Tax=Stylonychia lemnae TaxID=5949 RepID=A0A078AC69_STYLE|nr:UNKNOWN [Stylonychia lemnae]|eukprot:CDW79436.1 UNKNOWN [Stylonychia lemnae]
MDEKKGSKIIENFVSEGYNTSQKQGQANKDLLDAQKKKYLIVAPLKDSSFNSSLKSKKDIVKFLRRQLSLNTEQKEQDKQSDEQLKKDGDNDSFSIENSVVSLQIDDDMPRSKFLLQQLQPLKVGTKSKNINIEFQTTNSDDEGTLLRRSKYVSQQSAPLPANYSLGMVQSQSTPREYDTNLQKIKKSSRLPRLTQNNFRDQYRRAATIKLEDINEDLDSVQESQESEKMIKPAAQEIQGVQKTEAQQRWVKLSNLFRTINLLKNQETVKLEKASDIVSEIRRYPKKLEKREHRGFFGGFGNDSFQQSRKENRFFNAICHGGTSALEKIQNYLDNDPKQHMYEKTNPNHTINRPNTFGLRPLYLGYGILNLKQLTNIRNHINIVSYLLNNFEWSKTELKECIQLTEKSSAIRKLLTYHVKSKYGTCSTFCCLIVF